MSQKRKERKLLSVTAFNIEKLEKDFPGDPLVKNPPCKAGDTVSIPGQETKIPMLWSNKACMPQLQSPCAATKDPT